MGTRSTFKSKSKHVTQHLLHLLFVLLYFFLLIPEHTEASSKKRWVESWTLETSRLTTPRAGSASIVYENNIYLAGGGLTLSAKGTLDSVEYTTVNADGTLSPWKLTTKLTGRRVFSVGVEHNGYFYVIGGERGIEHDDLLNTIERAKILPGGGLGKWKEEPSVMGTPRRAPVAFVLGERLYVSGGFNGTFLTDVESAEIRKDGSLGPFRNESSDTKTERYIHSGIVHKEKIYVFGGHSRKEGGAYNLVEWTKVDPEEGYLDLWQPGPKMPTKRYLSGAVSFDDTIYLVGGRNAVILVSVEKVNLTGNPSASQGTDWKVETSLHTPRNGMSVVRVKNSIYAIGGTTFDGILDSTERATIEPGKNLGHWADKNDPPQPGKPLIHPDAMSHFTLAEEFVKHGNIDYAISEIEEGIRLSPNVAEAYNMLGDAHSKKGDLKSAKKAFTKALEITPGYTNALFNMGITSYNLKQNKDAIAAYSELIKQVPDHYAARKNLGIIYLDTGAFKKAIPHFEYLLKSHPEDIMLKGFLQFAKEKAPTMKR